MRKSFSIFLLVLISIILILANGCTSGGDSDSKDNDGDGYTVAQGDCDDNNTNLYPGANDVCGDGVDQDCDGSDEACPIVIPLDDDGDGYTVAQGDCDDNNVNVNPGATETCGDGVDQDCDGSDLICLEPTCFDKAPKEQLDENKVKTTRYPSPPAGYNSVIAWAQALIGETKYGNTGKVIIENLSLWEVKNGQRNLVTDKIVSWNTVWGFMLNKSDWYVPNKWVCPPEPQPCNLTTTDGVNVTPEGYVELNVSTNPSKIYHFWNTEWPRPSAEQNSTYYVKAKVKTTGNAMIQIGFDYWETVDGGDHLEAAYSDWLCNTGGEWQEVTAGDAE